MKQADILIANARAWTAGTAADCDALAIAGNEIVFMGDAASAKALRHKGTRVIDAQGASVLPGFESHMHIFSGAAELDQLHLAGGASRPACWPISSSSRTTSRPRRSSVSSRW